MARTGRVLFFAAFVVVVGGAAWAQFTLQRSQADDAASRRAAVATVYDAVVQTENAARDESVTHTPAQLDAFTESRDALTRAIGRARSAIDDSTARAQFDHERALIAGWRAEVERDVAAATAGLPADATRAAQRGAQLTGIRSSNDAALRALERHARDERDTAGVQGLLLIVGCCVLFAAMNWLLFVREERRAQAARDRQLAFGEQLQHARSVDAARRIVARHLEAVAPGSMVLVAAADDTSPAGRPVYASGERVATVIIRSERELSPGVERQVHDSLLRAGPVLATLHSLADAQTSAATDHLTGLGNRRLVEDALARLVARARRTGERFAIAVIDLDRFKSVNDAYGHAGGDALLVEVGRALERATREYDIVGRHGGDEFIVLLAGLGSDEAVTVMDRCRVAIAEVRVGTPPVGVTASIGVAPSGPTLFGDATALMRAADDAVYVAKAHGGDCVVVGATTDQGPGAQASALRA